MAYMIWNPSLSVKNAMLDAQHRKLISLVNEFHDAMAANRASDSMLKLMNGLVIYTKTHFRTEEQLFDQYGYPDSGPHKQEHEKLVKQVNEIMERLESGKLVLTLELMNMLKDWIASHIKGVDMKYSQFFLSKGLT